ncbi:hypothetical protein CEQ51_25895 [Pseudomonas thivervalensis]|uniref:Uncharacterized protein n=1 Tax=Pseudomonas thivervalensis TaxID=86265 RepID=A0A2Z4ZI44_9PSED|nr:hypothetical protein CE140_25895 [Pseudomonas thivervalensis]AXA63356.1 hypothetical protein CEQ51_25895 [Pseudomonas thivervalensis]
MSAITPVKANSWRGSLLPLGCEAAPNLPNAEYQTHRTRPFTTASQPSGSKLPRHRRGAVILKQYSSNPTLRKPSPLPLQRWQCDICHISRALLLQLQAQCHL